MIMAPVMKVLNKFNHSIAILLNMDSTTYAELKNKNIKILVEGSQRAIKTNTHIIHTFSWLDQARMIDSLALQYSWIKSSKFKIFD